MSEGPTAEGIRMRKKKRFVWLRYDLEDQLEILQGAMSLFKREETTNGMQSMHEMTKEEDVLKLKIQALDKMLTVLSSAPADSNVNE